MAGETFAPPIPPSGSTFMAGHTARVRQIGAARQALVVLGKPRYIHLGGIESDGHTGETYERLRNAVEIPLCAEDFRGLTVTLRVWARLSELAGPETYMQVRLRNMDDGSDVAETEEIVSTSLAQYEAVCTLPEGTTPKWCRLEIVSSDGTPAYAFGGLEVKL